MTAHNPDTREKLPICERLRVDAKWHRWCSRADQADNADRAADTIEALVEALEANATALNAFIYIIAHRFDGDGTYYWMRDPTHEEAQSAMEANNNAATAISRARNEQVAK